jgi:hypothetical protein
LLTIHMMAIEMLESDPTFLSDQSFFCTDFQTQHSCDISTKLGSERELWCETDMKEFWDSLETNFNNEPDFELEVMSNKVESQTLSKTKIDPQIDINYLDASAFLSPISIAPSSPTEQTVDNIEHLDLESDLSFVTDITNQSLDEELDSTSAMEILNSILSANSSDNEDSQEEIFDSAVNAVQYFANDSIIAEARPQSRTEIVSNNLMTDFSENNRRKRQVKRKIPDIESESRAPKGSKRSKASQLEKRERKKDQNKSAANRYRIKKRAEQESIEELQTEEQKHNESLKVQLEKLQMEFNVLYPLAEVAFRADPVRNPKLQLLHIRVLNNNLLD